MSYVQHVFERFIAVVLTVSYVAGCAMVTGIPDLDAADGRIYAQRCGGCHGTSPVGGHGVPDPRLRTMAEWEQILTRMEQLIRERGLAPLGISEREAIVSYLSRHAKS